jgi:hypothetical protein
MGYGAGSFIPGFLAENQPRLHKEIGSTSGEVTENATSAD